MTTRGSEVLAFTPTYGERLNIVHTITDLRGSAGMWFDWGVWAGAPSQALQAALERLLADRQLQFLQCWDENRGQHYATKEALELARALGYRWLLRLDDDVMHKTKRWLRKLVDRTEELRRIARDGRHRIIAAPRIIGLNHQPKVEGQIQLGQSFQVNLVELLGGVCRLHPVEFLANFEPDLFMPTGRGDPQSIGVHADRNEGLLAQYPDIRMIHKTDQLEEEDTPEMAHLRKMSRYWPWLGSIPQEAQEEA